MPELPELAFDHAKLHARSLQLTAQVRTADQSIPSQAAFNGRGSPHLPNHWLRHVLLISGSSGHTIMNNFVHNDFLRYYCCRYTVKIFSFRPGLVLHRIGK
jgi:hypothetical protein